MSKIFISYRREDSGGFAWAIYQHLAKQFGAKAIFMDLETLRPGSDFSKEIKHTLAQTKVMLVLIGSDWIGSAQDGASRIYEPNDFVRLEVALGLQYGIMVIPILLGNAVIPPETVLPEDIRGLLKHQAAKVTIHRFEADMESIVSASAKALGAAPGWKISYNWLDLVCRWMGLIGRWLLTPIGNYCVLVALYFGFVFGFYLDWLFSANTEFIFNAFDKIGFIKDLEKGNFAIDWIIIDIEVRRFIGEFIEGLFIGLPLMGVSGIPLIVACNLFSPCFIFLVYWLSMIPSLRTKNKV